MSNENNQQFIDQIQQFDSAIANAARERMSDTKTSEKASRLLVSFVSACERSDVEIDASAARVNVYALEKITRIMQAIALDNLSMIDQYTLAIMYNARANRFKNMNSITQQACLSSEIESEEIDQTLRFRRAKGSSTASTQASSTRAALSALRIVTENARDAIAFNTDSEEDHVAKLYAMIRDKKFTESALKR